MARPQLTGAGQQRLQTLEDSLAQLQLLHGLVERMALAVKAHQPLQPLTMQLRRKSVPLVDLLKGQYGTLADQVTQLTLSATRGGSDRYKVNALREGIGSLRNAIEVAIRKVYEQYAVDADEAEQGAPEA